MAVYLHNALDVPSGLPWIDVLPFPISWVDDAVSITPTLVVLANTDGTQTRIAGVNLTFDPISNLPLGGTVNSIQRVNPLAVFPPLEKIDSGNPVSPSLNFPFTFLHTDLASQVFAALLNGNDTMNGYAGTDFLLGSPGADTLNGGTGSHFADYEFAFTGGLCQSRRFEPQYRLCSWRSLQFDREHSRLV
jgi:hypothetical protein